MNKHKHGNNTNTTEHVNTETKEPAPEPETEIVISEEAVVAPEAAPEAQAAAIVKAAPDHSLARMGDALPHMRADLARTMTVQPEEFSAALARLSDAQRTAFETLIERLNPNDEYMDSSRTGPVINVLKIDQGAGDDKTRPENSVKGAAYASPSGVLLTAPTENWSRTLNVPQTLRVHVLASYNGRIFFAPKDSNNKPVAPVGVELHGNAPICVSRDRKVGSYYDQCRECPNRPFANGSYDKDACRDNVDLFVCSADLMNVYRIQVAASCFKTLSDVIRQKVEGNKPCKPWDLAFDISTEPKNRSQTEQYFVWKAVLVTEGNPRGKATDPAVRGVLELLARQIRTEIHLPALAAIYARAKEGPKSENPTVPANVADVAAAANGMDYSAGV